MVEKEISKEEKIRVLKLPYAITEKLRDLLDGFKWAIHKKNQSAVIVCDGRSGMGKTTLSFQIAKYMSESFSLDFVYYNPEDFLKALTKAKKGDTLVFDEAMLLSSRQALSLINKMIVVAMSMIRSKNLCIIFNVNSIFDLDRNLALSRADLLLHCYGDSLTDKGKFLAFFKGGDGHDRIKSLYINGKKFYSYAKPKCNFYSRFSSYFVLDEYEYEKNKQLGVNNFLAGNKQEHPNTRFLKQRNCLIYYIWANKIMNFKQMENFFYRNKLGITASSLSEAKTRHIEYLNNRIELDKILNKEIYKEEDSLI